MTSNNPTLTPLSRFASLLTLLGAALYYTGWVYRWAYYGFFQIEITTLDLTFTSFYLAAFQVLFGDYRAMIKAICVIFITAIVIIPALKLPDLIQKLIIWFWQFFLDWIRQQSPRWHRNIGLLRNHLPSSQSLKFLAALVDELIIILLILTALFWLARWQADVDVWKDVVNETSSLPVVTVIIPEDGAKLGRRLDNPLAGINPSEFRIIGDQGLYKQIRGKELTSLEKPDEPRVWRLLRNEDGYFYIFPALPREDTALRVPVLMINESSEQLVILSPQPSGK